MPIIPRDTSFLTGVQYLLYTPFSALRKREVSWISRFPVITTFQARHGIRTDGIQLIYNTMNGTRWRFLGRIKSIRSFGEGPQQVVGAGRLDFLLIINGIGMFLTFFKNSAH